MRRAAKVDAMPIWRCAECGAEKPGTMHQRRQRYCSRLCMAKAYSYKLIGSSNPNFTNAGIHKCRCCGKTFKNYNKNTKFCSLSCRDKESQSLRTNAKKDANHHIIVDALTAGGVFVRDLSRALFGVPDLLVWHNNAWHLIEIKNPQTTYGRKGLNKSQKEWAKNWSGGPVYVIRTTNDVDLFLAGELKPETFNDKSI